MLPQVYTYLHVHVNYFADKKKGVARIRMKHLCGPRSLTDTMYSDMCTILICDDSSIRNSPVVN